MNAKIGALALLMVSTSTAAFAQVSPQPGDVVMRRPLPIDMGGSGQDACTPGDPTCPPAPTPTPSTPTPSPAPTPTPTPTSEQSNCEVTGNCPSEDVPVLDDDPLAPPPPVEVDFCDQVNADGTGYCDEYSYCKDDYANCGSFEYEWTVGPWLGGSSCGTESTMTRTATCVRREMQYDWANEGSGGMIEVGSSAVDPSMCASWGLTRPSTRYVGSRANCQRELVVENGSWLATCSSQTQREQIVKCMEAGREVPQAWCRDDIATGGTPRALPEPVLGENYETCEVRWAPSQRGSACEPEDAVPGGPPATWRRYDSYSCEYFDNASFQWLYAEDQFCIDRNRPKPADVTTQTGTCTVKYSAQYSGCGGAVLSETERNFVSEHGSSSWLDGAEITRFCRAANATCCVYEHRPDRTRTIIRATNGQSNSIDGWAGRIHGGNFYWDPNGDLY